MLTEQITSLFACPNIPTPTTSGSPTPTLAHFVAYALHRTRLPSIVTFASLLLLQRLKTRFPAARGSSGHRLFISAFMISSKVICDDTYSNQSWGVVAQKMFALKEINQMEREMCGYLEWSLNVEGQEVADFESRIRQEFSPKPVVAASSSSASACGPAPVPHLSSHGSSAYPSPETTPDPNGNGASSRAYPERPIRPVPSPHRPSRVGAVAKPTAASAYISPPLSPTSRPSYHSSHSHYLRPTHLSPNDSMPTSSASSSLVSSPASDNCRTPSPVAITSAAPVSRKPIEAAAQYRYTPSSVSVGSHYAVGVAGW